MIPVYTVSKSIKPAGFTVHELIIFDMKMRGAQSTFFKTISDFQHDEEVTPSDLFTDTFYLPHLREMTVPLPLELGLTGLLSDGSRV
jgi:hypothetical protein